MEFYQNPEGLIETEESIMAFFKKTSENYKKLNDYEVKKCLNGWYEVNLMTIGGYPQKTETLVHFRYKQCLVIMNPTFELLDGLNLLPNNMYCMELSFMTNSIVLVEYGEKVTRENLLDYLKKRYKDKTLFIIKQRDSAFLIGHRFMHGEFTEIPYSEFCIAKFRKGLLRQLILNPDPCMVAEEGF